MKKHTMIVGVGLFAMLAMVSPLSSDTLLTNEDIVRLTKAGLHAPVIVAKIEASPTNFDLSVDGLITLADAGLENGVIMAMIKVAKPSHAPRDPGSPGVEEGTATSYEVGERFRDRLRSGGEGPEMIVVTAGRFRMGCLAVDYGCNDDENPVRVVAFAQPFALSVHEVTFADYDRFTFPEKVHDQDWGRGSRPAIGVSLNDAKRYVAWLSEETGADYRLPSEAEWEYAARAGTTTSYSWGNDIGVDLANCLSVENEYGTCGNKWRGTAPVGSFAPNAWGLYDMHGNVAEWVEDCWNDTYRGAPEDGSAWLTGDCKNHIYRGGSFGDGTDHLRAAHRGKSLTFIRDFEQTGIRLARTLKP